MAIQRSRSCAGSHNDQGGAGPDAGIAAIAALRLSRRIRLSVWGRRCLDLSLVRRYTLSLLHCPENVLQDEVVDLESGDILLLMDLSCSMTVEAGGSKLYKNLLIREFLPMRSFSFCFRFVCQFFSRQARKTHTATG